MVVATTLTSWSANGQELSSQGGDPDLAQNLYRNGYFLLSALEWSRVVAKSTDEARTGAANMEIAYSFWRMNDKVATYRILDSLVSRTNTPDAVRLHALTLKATVALGAGDFDVSAAAAEEALNIGTNFPLNIQQDLKKCIVARNIVRNQLSDAASMMRRMSLAPEAFTHEIESVNLPYKSPALSGALSAILPGSGQAYCSRWYEASAALFVNGALAGSAYECFDNDLPILGSAVVLAAVTWYAGNIFNAVNVAHKYNDEIRARIFTDWLRKLDITIGEDSVRTGFHCAF